MPGNVGMWMAGLLGGGKGGVEKGERVLIVHDRGSGNPGGSEKELRRGDCGQE